MTERPITPNGHGLGYIPSPFLPTDRIYELTPEHLLRVAASIDLRSTATTRVMNQDGVGCCVSCASVGCFEWLQQAILGSYTAGSVLALYRWARDDDEISGDTGSTPLGNFDAMSNTGVSPNSNYPWPFTPENPSGTAYNANTTNAEPPASAKTAAAGFKVSNYARVNGASDMHTQTGLDRIKATLSTPVTATNPKTGAKVTLPGLVAAVGLSIYAGYEQLQSGGTDIPMPASGETSYGAHENVIYGYNDTHTNLDGSKGALLVKNSWGATWGTNSYAWMPYNYLLQGYAAEDVWVITMETELQPTGSTPTNPVTPPSVYGPITSTSACNLNMTVRVREYQPKTR